MNNPLHNESSILGGLTILVSTIYEYDYIGNVCYD